MELLGRTLAKLATRWDISELAKEAGVSRVTVGNFVHGHTQSKEVNQKLIKILLPWWLSFFVVIKEILLGGKNDAK